MGITYDCARCGRAYAVGPGLAGRAVRCKACGQVGRIPGSVDGPGGSETYALTEVVGERSRPEPVALEASGGRDQASSGPPTRGFWRGAVRAATRDASVLPRASLCLVALSLADLFVTYRLLLTSPAFYESNPVARWFFDRWNIAGMATFKLAVMGAVIAIAEVVERLRPGRGRFVLLVGCLVTAAVVWHGLRLLGGWTGGE